MVFQRYIYQKEKEQRLIKQVRAQRLQLALADFQESKQPTKVKLNQAGKIERANIELIFYCKGVRDDVEIVFLTGEMSYITSV